MLDPDLRKQLEVINYNIVRIQRGASWWRALLNGILTGFGYVIGFVVALVMLGWILNVIGVIPAFQREVDGWRQLLQQTQQQRLPAIKGAATPTR